MYLFLDTEFTDFTNMDLISIGLVSEDGQHEFYRENTSHNGNFRSTFVNQVVMPLLEGGEYAKPYSVVALDLGEWLDSLPTDNVTIVCDYTGDWQLFDALQKQARIRRVKITPVMLNYAFNEMLSFRGFHDKAEVRMTAVGLMAQGQVEYFQQVDHRQHHSLVDAKANRHGWLRAYEYAKERL